MAEYLEKYPERETFYLLDTRTGKKVCTVPAIHYAGSGGPYPPPIVGADGHYYLTYVKCRVGESQPIFIRRLDIENNRAVIREVAKGMIDALPYGACDITAMLSMSGSILFDWGYAGTKACELETGKMTVLPQWRALSADWQKGAWFFGGIPSDDPGRTSSVVISNRRVFYGYGPIITACKGGGERK